MGYSRKARWMCVFVLCFFIVNEKYRVHADIADDVFLTDMMSESYTDYSTEAVKVNRSDGYLGKREWPKHSPGNNQHCRIRSTNKHLHQEIKAKVGDKKVKLIDYNIKFANYSENPMLQNMTINYEANLWSRSSSSHGLTLLSLAFNYGVLSMMTLTFGVEQMDAELEDNPPGCFGDLGEKEKISTIVHLLMKDFGENGHIVIKDNERICRKVIKPNDGYATFEYMCCSEKPYLEGHITCDHLTRNIWVNILLTLLTIIRVSVILFGPLLLVPLAKSMSKQCIPYAVKPQDPLHKTICIVRRGDPEDYTYTHKLDLRNCQGFKKLFDCASTVTLGEPVKVVLKQFDILVSYSQLLSEYYVPVGLWTSLFRSICQCKIRDVSPFTECCDSNMNVGPGLRRMKTIPWIKFWQRVGRFCLILLLPLPYCLRLIIYFIYEKEEIDKRNMVISDLRLKPTMDDTFLHTWSPQHPLFIAIYVVYFLTAILVYASKGRGNNRFRKTLVTSFIDMSNQKWQSLLHAGVSNIIWPFKQFGLYACILAPVYWAIVMPVTIIFYVLFCVPIVYLSYRILYKTKAGFSRQVWASVDNIVHVVDDRYAMVHDMDNWAEQSRIEALLERGKKHKSDMKKQQLHCCYWQSLWLREAFHSPAILGSAFGHIISSVLCLLSVYGTLFIMSECIGCLVEILVFTLMGIIINAASMLRYVTYALLVIVYCHACFKNVPAKYLKLNKAIFGEVKGRCKDLEEVTCLPSNLQENRAFKSQEMSEQGSHENPDDVGEVPCHWMINDLTLFVDNEDVPHIPRKLFDEICEIKVSGAPGPIYASLIGAFKQLLVILCFLLFVFLTVLSFGTIYQVSNTNQMMATMGGGFIPLFLKNFLSPAKKGAIEINTVSFKSKLDEIIKSFKQEWLIYDMPFEVYVEKEENERKKDDPEHKSTEYKIAQDGGGGAFFMGKPHGPQRMSSVEGKPNQGDEEEEQGQMPTIGEEDEEGKTRGGGGERRTKASKIDTNFGKTTESEIEMSSMKTSGRRVSECIRLSHVPKAPKKDVDILIYLPETIADEEWLDEWSDISEYEGMNGEVPNQVLPV